MAGGQVAQGAVVTVLYVISSPLLDIGPQARQSQNRVSPSQCLPKMSVEEADERIVL